MSSVGQSPLMPAEPCKPRKANTDLSSRRSQYDRGTRLAEIEDSYETGHHHLRSQPQTFRSPQPFGVFTQQYTTGYGPAYF